MQHTDKQSFIPKDKYTTISQGDMATSLFDRSNNPVWNAVGRSYVPAALITVGANLPKLASTLYKSATVGDVLGGTVGGTLGDVATNGVTKLATGKSWNDYMTSKGVPIEVATFSNPGAWIGGTAGALYGRGVGSRYRFANMNIMPPGATLNAIKNDIEHPDTWFPQYFRVKDSHTLDYKDISHLDLNSGEWVHEDPKLMVRDIDSFRIPLDKKYVKR